MKALQVKKLLFVVLLGMAAYVWWGNIQSFRDSSAAEDTALGETSPKIKAKKMLTPIGYRVPQMNPFRRYNVARSAKPTTLAQAPDQIEPLHALHKLKGIVGKGAGAQAVVQLPNGLTRVLSVADSVGSWKVKEIHDLFVAIVNGRRYDTLFLDTHGL